MAKRLDELSPAIRRIWAETMSDQGFSRVGRRNFARFANGMLHMIWFQVSTYGGGDFCAHASAETAAGPAGILFRLKHAKGADLWLNSATAERADRSSREMLSAMIDQALPFFIVNSNAADHAQALRKETWGSEHHLKFAIGVAELLADHRESGLRELKMARRLYDDDTARVPWAAEYLDRVDRLIEAVEKGEDQQLIGEWRTDHLIKVGLSRK